MLFGHPPRLSTNQSEREEPRCQCAGEALQDKSGQLINSEPPDAHPSKALPVFGSSFLRERQENGGRVSSLIHELERSAPYPAAMNRDLWKVDVYLADQLGARAPYILHAEIMELRRELADEKMIAVLIMVDHAVSEWAKPRVADAIH